MYASTSTKLPLATFYKFMGINPLHAAQVYFKPTSSGTPRSNCARVMPQYEWQDVDAVSREEVARAIAQAEADIERKLGYRLLPSWEVDEWQPTERFWRKELVTYGYTDLRGYAQSVRPRWGHLVSGGIRGSTLLDADAAIVYTDTDGDGYAETATVTVTGIGSAVQACEIRLFYPGHTDDPNYEIKPITVSLSSGTATITFRRELAVLEILQEPLEIEEVDGGEDSNFLTEVGVYRIYNDPSQMANLLWNTLPGACGCGSSTCQVCQYETQTACLNLRGDPLQAPLFTYVPATWNATDEDYDSASLANQRIPDIVRLWYYAGRRDKRLTCPTVEMDRELAYAVAAYACSMLDRPPCGCVLEIWEKWRVDVAFTSGATELSSYQISQRDLDSEFGTRRGALFAWKKIRDGGLEAVPQVALVP